MDQCESVALPGLGLRITRNVITNAYRVNLISTNFRPTFSVRANGRYLQARIRGRFRSLHRLVALAFVDNPRPDIFATVDHKDHNTLNNAPENLRWVNPQLNRLNQRFRESQLMTQDDGTVEYIYCRCVVYRGTDENSVRALAVQWWKELFGVFYATHVESPVDMNDRRAYWEDTLILSDDYDFDKHHADVQSYRLLPITEEAYNRIIYGPRYFDAPRFLE